MLTSSQVLTVVQDTLASVEFCFFITLNASGQPNTRLMQPFAPDADLTLWLGTSPASRKVQDIRRDPRVTLAFHHAPAVAYVTLHGLAEVITDIQARQQRWREDWRAFFPDGPTGDDYVLLRCVPAHIEALHFTQHITPAPFGLRPAILRRRGDHWDLTEA